MCCSKCDKKGDCRYDHDPKRIRSEREKINFLWKRELEKEQPPVSTKVVQPKQLPGQQGGVRLLRKEDESEDSECNELISSTIQMESRILSAITSYEVTHEVISLDIGGKLFPKAGVALLDTGASHEDFISEEFVNSLGVEELVEPIDSYVKTADGRNIPLRGRLEAKISFEDPDGKIHEATLTFTVFSGLNVPVIIGIKSILKHFSVAFVNKVKNGAILDSLNGELTPLELIAIRSARDCPVNPIQG